MEIWHLALAEDWDEAVATGSYRVSTLGRTLAQEGFIHCSRPEQAPGVAARFYADVTAPLRILVMDDDRVRASGVEVKYEDAGNGELFPHIYGAIDPAWVVEARSARMKDGTLHVA
ncbi:MAG TPA: DUF952 domain-containing protein [Demequina sp.]|nr:DUF952 domain-containing protein [Demequina sp.]